jgi:hypothetical protein
MLKNPISMKEILRRAKLNGHFFAKVLLLLLDVSAGYCQRALVDESGMIRKQMGMHIRSEMVALQGLPCAPTPQG